MPCETCGNVDWITMKTCDLCSDRRLFCNKCYPSHVCRMDRADELGRPAPYVLINKAKFESIMQDIKDSERDGLKKMPERLAIELQSGYLMGYADCWNKIKKAIEQEQSQ